MLAFRLATCTALRRGLHQQTLQRDRLAAIRTVAVDAAVEPMQGRFDLRHLVGVAHRLRIVLGGASLGDQIVQPIGQQISQGRQVGLCGDVHGVPRRSAQVDDWRGGQCSTSTGSFVRFISLLVCEPHSTSPSAPKSRLSITIMSQRCSLAAARIASSTVPPCAHTP